MQRKLPILSIVIACLLTANDLVTAVPPGTAFTYQGQLKNAGSPANGNTPMTFSIWDAVSGGAQQGPTLIFSGGGAVNVTNGLFTAELDFGVNPYAANAARWLEITVNGTTLAPRQPLTPTPFALNTRGVNVDASDNVGIGTTSPSNKLSVAGDADISGNVGIGTTNPNAKLSVSGNTSINGNLTVSDTDQQCAALLGSNSLGTSLWFGNNHGSEWTLGSTGSGSPYGANKFIVRDETTSAARMTIDSAGKVGIGTTTPGAPIHVVTNGIEPARLESSSTIGTWFNLYNSTAGARYWRLLATGTGNGEGVGKLLVGTGTDAVLNGTVLTFEPGGNIGIGTPTPASKLDVRGDIKLGSSGQYFAVGGGENLRIIRGIVDNNGNVLYGSGYSVVRNSTGSYTVTFSPGFSDVPALLVTPFSGGTPRIATTNAVSAANGTALLWTTGGALVDTFFSFTAIGPK